MAEATNSVHLAKLRASMAIAINVLRQASRPERREGPSCDAQGLQASPFQRARSS